MSHQIAEKKSSPWIYAEVSLLDGDRILHPTHVSCESVIFRTPPNLKATRVEIVIDNGPNQFRSIVDVLPHAEGATEIPIRSINADQESSPRLTA